MPSDNVSRQGVFRPREPLRSSEIDGVSRRGTLPLTRAEKALLHLIDPLLRTRFRAPIQNGPEADHLEIGEGTLVVRPQLAAVARPGEFQSWCRAMAEEYGFRFERGPDGSLVFHAEQV
jgi:hypothetical protein